MAQRRRFPAGVQDFEKIITDGFVYVDKTEYVYRLANEFGDAIFLSRPRRFGKSLLCSTLKHYFLGHKELFRGLAIDRLETEWKRYPVLHFDMSQCKHDNVCDVASSLDSMLRRFEVEYGCEGAETNSGARLRQLVEAAHRQAGERVVLIFDEYDSPVLNVVDDKEKLDAIRSIYNSFYGPVKYMAEHLRFVFITGITKFSQMSIFSTINNLSNISFDRDMEALCGITPAELEANFRPEIEQMSAMRGENYESTLMALRERYDGYRFGSRLTEIYNPFSLVNVFRTLEMSDYWFDSATPSALVKILNLYNFKLSDIENNKVVDTSFNMPFDNMSSAIPILFQSGYLTIKEYNKESEVYTLGIPNGEVRKGLYRTLMPYYLNSDAGQNNTFLATVREAILSKDDIDSALEAVKNYLSALPYDLSNKTERDFETIFRVMFDSLGVDVVTEVKNARGRCDVVLKNRSTIYVLELKIDGSATVDDALAQINEKDYLIPYWNDPRRKVKVGVIVDPETRTIKEWKAER